MSTASADALRTAVASAVEPSMAMPHLTSFRSLRDRIGTQLDRA
jgi:hypothetical protein